jgi:hypothetical protein
MLAWLITFASGIPAMGGHHALPTMQQQVSSSSYPELNSGSGAKWVKSLTSSRLSNFTGGHFSDVNLSSVLFTHRLDGPEFVKLQVWSAPGLTKPTFEEAMEQKYKPAKKGDLFGPSCELSSPQFLLNTYLKAMVSVHRGRAFVYVPEKKTDVIWIDESLVESTRDNPWLLDSVRACAMYAYFHRSQAMDTH